MTGRRDALKTLAWGVVWVVTVGWFGLDGARRAAHDLRLVLSAMVAPGEITDSWEDAEDRDDGGTDWHHFVAYTFTIPHGAQIRSASSGVGRLPPEWVTLEQPVPVEVEYDPRTPSTNRLSGDGSQTVREWFLRNVGLGGLLFVALLWPGIKIMRDALAELRSTPPSSETTAP